MGKAIFTDAGLALVKANGKVQGEALKANEKALDEGKWYLHGKSAEGKPRKRSVYVQYLRGYMDALKDLADGKELRPWTPKPEAPATTNLPSDITAIVAAAVKAALAKAGK